MEQCYLDVFHVADRFTRLKNVLKETKMLEYNRSQTLKNIERPLKSRQITVYACHEMLQQLSNDPRQWPTELEVADASALEQHEEVKRKYLELVNLAYDWSKMFQDVDAVLGDVEELSFFRNLHSANKVGTSIDAGEGHCSEEFSKLYKTKAEVENVIKDKRCQVELKRRELELLKLQEECGDVIGTYQKKVLENLKITKTALESLPRITVQENNIKLRALVNNIKYIYK